MKEHEVKYFVSGIIEGKKLLKSFFVYVCFYFVVHVHYMNTRVIRCVHLYI